MDTETLNTVFFSLFLLNVLWAVAGLIKPKLVLFFAPPENRRRLHAFGFAYACSLIFMFFAIAYDPASEYGRVCQLLGWGFIPVTLLYFRWLSASSSV